MTVIAWIVEGTWPDCVDAVRAYAREDDEVVLLHVTGQDVAQAAHGAFAGLFGRGHPERPLIVHDHQPHRRPPGHDLQCDRRTGGTSGGPPGGSRV